MFKKFLWVLLGAFLTLLIIFAINTFQLGNAQVEPGDTPVAEWDRDAMIDRFSRSVQYQTISFEDTLLRNNNEFLAFLEFIEDQFPLVHQRLDRTLFNNYTPLYRWEGTDSTLDPILLMGHYDVVPVDSTDIDGWKFSPFSGAVEDDYIWGRGTLDNKFTVMALLESAEYLLENGFQPARDIYFSFGHDEEVGGMHGARAVSRYFIDNDIQLQFVLDEGGGVIEGALPIGRPVALVGIAEKGYLSLKLTARSPGGHSSTPPQEKSISILSKAILDLENSPFPARVDGATEQMFEALGNKLPFTQRVVYANRWFTDRLFRRAMASDTQTAPMVKTTIAPTMIQAGVKDNVLPTRASAVINFRLLPGDTHDSVIEHVRSAINDDRIQIEPYSESLKTEPSSVSSTNTSSFQSVQQSIMDSFRDVYVAPYLVIGATDSRHFEPVTNNIFRFAPFKMPIGDMERIHGTNERVSVSSYSNSINFYSHFIQMSAGE